MVTFLSTCVLDQWEWGDREGDVFREKMDELLGTPWNRSRRGVDQMPVVFIPEVGTYYSYTRQVNRFLNVKFPRNRRQSVSLRTKCLLLDF